MATGEYQQAEKTFRKAIRDDPDNGLAHYYLGRFLLAQDKISEAQPHFQRSTELDQNDADYFFWLGITYGELGDSKAERLSYTRALQIRKRHPQANLYLGHLQLKAGQLEQALKSYDFVLKQIPTNSAALYNRALILDIQRQSSDARKAWLEYLKWYPAGRHAIQAADNLNTLGDFSFENHPFGWRIVTLAEIKFQHSKNSVSISSYPSLRLIGTIVSNLKKGKLQIVVYVNNDKNLARQRAAWLQKTLYELLPDMAPNRIQSSWIGTRETIVRGGRKYSRNEAVRFFLTDWK